MYFASNSGRSAGSGDPNSVKCEEQGEEAEIQAGSGSVCSWHFFGIFWTTHDVSKHFETWNILKDVETDHDINMISTWYFGNKPVCCEATCEHLGEGHHLCQRGECRACAVWSYLWPVKHVKQIRHCEETFSLFLGICIIFVCLCREDLGKVFLKLADEKKGAMQLAEEWNVSTQHLQWWDEQVEYLEKSKSV